MQDAYPLGTVLDSIKIIRVESEWGLVCEAAKGASGFVHVSFLFFLLRSSYELFNRSLTFQMNMSLVYLSPQGCGRSVVCIVHELLDFLLSMDSFN